MAVLWSEASVSQSTQGGLQNNKEFYENKYYYEHLVTSVEQCGVLNYLSLILKIVNIPN